MKKASLAAAFAASLSLSSMSSSFAEEAPATEARVAEEQVLGAADEDAREVATDIVVASSPPSVAEDAPATEMRAEVSIAEEQVLGVADEDAREVATDIVVAASPPSVAEDAPAAEMEAAEARIAEEEVLGAADESAREVATDIVVAASPPSVAEGASATEMVAADARAAEERVLGAADDEARFLAYQPFTREIATDIVVTSSLDEALAGSGVPMVVLLEAVNALRATVNTSRDVKPGDRLHVRYEQTFTAEGAPVGIGRVIWAELKLASRGPVVVHRFRTHDKIDRLWFANGLSATPPSMRLPLETVSVSSGFGLRADPFDQPPVLSATGKKEPMGGPLRSRSLPPGLPTGGIAGNGGSINMATPLGASLGLAPYGNWQASVSKFQPKVHGALFMHEGIDLVAPAGTPVYAAADGVVVGAAPNGRYGNWIRIDHGDKLATVYGHLMAFAPGIEPGETVTRGELIGFVGSTGRSTGAHLHFEVQTDGKPVNPITHPELKAMQLHGLDLERFRKQLARSTEERVREDKVAATGL